ncbi:hypothetical protein BFP72_10785 [Reichenbachiella sp. 5M10]|uniref:DUF3575 domain-containing protein n=1 Tax=Reichenbachiella sp. 5M10 TaxID=1889772 RepID=UPI000C158C66|nr:DUF3575 domain-containing protein [Reichenbachiella sp. 5M10]PIB35843.1 hypothetical protein BFP72_10785 [Reichenbachiella sp. 5M10]
MKSNLLLLILCLGCYVGQAQTDVNLNVVNILLFDASGSIEKGINDNISFGGFTGYFYGMPDLADEDGYNKYFYIGPELKYYVYPKGKLDRFFVGLYAKYSNGEAKASNWDYYSNTPAEQPVSHYNKFAFGISMGSKWVTKNNIIFGFFGGLDRNLVSNYENKDYLNYDTGSSDHENFGFRIGVHIGYRFDAASK